MAPSTAVPVSAVAADEIEAFAVSVADFFRSSEAYVHRRVERLVLPLPEEPLLRRSMSVDFTVPPQPDGYRGPTLVPLSLAPKWPPLVSLDLREESDRPLPFLTRRQNVELDGEVLVALARQTVPELPEHLARRLRSVAALDPPMSFVELAHVLPSLTMISSNLVDRTRRLLRNDEVLVGLASELASNTLLWFQVAARPGDRRVVKFAYERPETLLRPSGRGTVVESLALAPYVVKFDLPHFGRASSYHLTITAPSPLRIVDADINVRGLPTPTATGGTRIAWSSDSGGSWNGPRNLDIDARCEPTFATFYLHGDRTACEAQARVAVEVETQGFLNGAVAAALAVTILLGMLAFDMSSAAKVADAGVSVLLLGPGLLAYALVRPREHILVGGYLRWLRRALIGSGVLPVAGAITLLLSGDPPATAAVWAMKAFAALGVLVTAAFTAAWALPRGATRVPLSARAANRAVRRGLAS